MDFTLRTRIFRDLDAVDRLGERVSEIGGRRVLLVTDPGIVAAGHVERGMQALQRAGAEVHVFDGAQENPTTENVDQGLEVARRCEPEMIVGLGGGSSMDCAKGINFLYTNGGRMQDYWGVGKALRPMLPMIAVPTTAGTGSEMQSFALISDAQTHVKMACGDVKASCRVAILDPRLTLTQPASVTALTGIDALSHALETYVTRRRTPQSLLYSRESWRLIASSLPRVLSDPDDLTARADMQLGAAYAGVAIENSMLGASHALANPLTAAWGTAHGQAVGMMLPHVIRFNSQQPHSSTADSSPADSRANAWYGELLEAAAGLPGCPAAAGGGPALADYVSQLLESAGLQTRLSELPAERGQLASLAESAAKQWTGQFNPREVDAESLRGLYEAAW